MHLVGRPMPLIPDKNVKEFMVDLKAVYQAPNLETAKGSLLILEEKWGKIYPQAVGTWTNNWTNISTFFDYSEPIRRTITTNAIE